MHRVTFRSQYSQLLGEMNSSLAELMELNTQASSQKKVNKPSDDPVATAQILKYRVQISSLEQYQTNADTADGWLSLADTTLTQVSTVLTSCKELAEQAATGTASKANRTQIGFELRELFEELVTLANTDFNGQYLFSGTKTDTASFSMSLGLTSNDEALSANYSIEGDTDYTNVVQFLSSGAVGGTSDLLYRYSSDGGDSWTTSTLAAGDTTLDLDGVRVTLQSGVNVSAVDTSNVSSTDNGSWLWVRPTAEYQGDDEDEIEVHHFGSSDITATASGSFGDDVIVRIDNSTAVGSNGAIEYSYSLDDGLSWVTGNVVSNSWSGNTVSLSLPSGVLDLTFPTSSSALQSGEQFIVSPRLGQTEFEISPTDSVEVTMVGKDVFGGVYQSPGASNATATLSGASNMFEVVGELLGYVETNNMDGIQEALEKLTTAIEYITTQNAKVGALENRVDVAEIVVSNLITNKTERMSALEDADITELYTKLAQQQLVYESVLASSSMIMNMSLINYL